MKILYLKWTETHEYGAPVRSSGKETLPSDIAAALGDAWNGAGIASRWKVNPASIKFELRES